ncbi:MAG: putative DNA modification/repair radical SAM protein [Lachnospiraceae bacterium]|nr:putative DNA modification/repair radical SAM protein [Lachnospiraceae bacterium]
MYEIKTSMTTEEKLEILADAAKYDVACTSSGVDRKGKKGELGNCRAAGVCHTFASDGRCISLLKILMTNHCIYDCKYCINRCSNDVPRAAFTPEEICDLTVEFYKRNYIEGLFLSSGIVKSPGHTMELMCRVLEKLRTEYHFNGYIHIKAIPGVPDELIAKAGYLADRVSINMEFAGDDSLKKFAPNKNFKTIMNPMEKISNTIALHRLAIGKDARMERSSGNRYLENSIFNIKRIEEAGEGYKQLPASISSGNLKRAFAPAGQSTQMIIGAGTETDYELLQTTQRLYQDYDLKRVFYSAYVPLNDDPALPAIGTPVPLLREHRLYQADWLLRYYGFRAGELLSEEKPDFNEQLDPKCDWALRHLDIFPVEIMTASFELLLRVPGIGPTGAKRIVSSRRYGSLNYEHLKKMGIVLKRAHYFITCNGKMMYKTPVEENYIIRELTVVNRKENWEIVHRNQYEQMSLFDDYKLG